MIAAPPDDQTSLTARQLNVRGGPGRLVRARVAGHQRDLERLGKRPRTGVVSGDVVAGFPDLVAQGDVRLANRRELAEVC